MDGTSMVGAIEALDAAEIPAADSDVCAVLLGHIKRTRGWLDAVEARVTSRLNQLYETAGAAPAADLHSRCGGVSSAEGKRKDRRSKTLDEAPSFGEALADGTIGAEHVDALANATTKLDDDIEASLFDDEAALLDAAATMSPERLGATSATLSAARNETTASNATTGNAARRSCPGAPTRPTA